jgi:hypothetical protein
MEFPAHKKKAQLQSWAFLFDFEQSAYGLTVWVEWLPCGTAARAAGESPEG